MAMTSQITATYSFISNSSSGRRTPAGVPKVSTFGTGSTFASGTPLLSQSILLQRKPVSRGGPISIRCEQSANEGTGLDVWLGRVAMVGFAAAIGVEIGTGKGLLENFGLTSPLPTVALGVTALVGVLTAIFIFQSASDK